MDEKAHQAKNLLESHLVSPEEKQILSEMNLNGRQTSQVSLRHIISAYSQLQHIAIKRLHKNSFSNMAK